MTGRGRNAGKRGRAVHEGPPPRESRRAQTELTLTGDRREVEAMALAVRRLAKARGLELGNVQIQPADETS